MNSKSTKGQEMACKGFGEIQEGIRLKLCTGGFLGGLGFTTNYLRIFQGIYLMISCDFQNGQKLARLVSSNICTVHAHVFAYLGLRSGRDVPGLFWDF